MVINMAAATNVGAATATADIDACNGKIIMNALKTENLVSLSLSLSPSAIRGIAAISS